jgi:hypothetical protein
MTIYNKFLFKMLLLILGYSLLQNVNIVTVVPTSRETKDSGAPDRSPISSKHVDLHNQHARRLNKKHNLMQPEEGQFSALAGILQYLEGSCSYVTAHALNIHRILHVTS